MRSELVRSLVPILALATLLVPLGSALSPEPPAVPDADDDAVGVYHAPDGCSEWDAASIQNAQAYQSAFRHYDEMPGFVDLLFIDEAEPALLALFDADRMMDELPAPVDPIHGIPVHVEATTFETLMAEPFQTAAAGLPPIPGGCVGIQPGARLGINGAGCSAHFLFTDQDGKFYLGTAGHCGRVGNRVSINNLGQSGTIIYRINAGIGRDFALIEIDEDKYNWVDPAMCYWGGPTREHSSGGGRVLHYGFPIIYGSFHQTRPRVAETQAWSGERSFTIAGIVASGDSGSGAQVKDGQALGTLTHVNVPLVFFAHSGPYAFGTKVTHGMALAEAATGLDLELVTAPLNVHIP